VRRRNHDELRRQAEDPELARQFLLRTALFESLREASRLRTEAHVMRRFSFGICCRTIVGVSPARAECPIVDQDDRAFSAGSSSTHRPHRRNQDVSASQQSSSRTASAATIIGTTRWRNPRPTATPRIGHTTTHAASAHSMRRCRSSVKIFPGRHDRRLAVLLRRNAGATPTLKISSLSPKPSPAR